MLFRFNSLDTHAGGRLKKAQTEKADKGMIRSFIRHKLHKSR